MNHLFSWQGIDGHGQIIIGRDFANSRADLKYKLYQRQILIRKITLQPQYWLNLRRWLNNKQALFFLTQLHALLNIGLNLKKAVDILEQNQTNSLLSELMACLKQQLSSGEQLSSALGLFPQLFDKIILQLIHGGEATGRIDMSVLQAFDYYNQKQKTLNQLLTALLYPLILLFVSLAVVATLMVFVIPQFESIYSQSKAQLPWLTLKILAISNWISLHFWLLCFGTVSGGIGLLVLRSLGQIHWTDHAPIIGKTIKRVNTLRFCQTLTRLYAAGLNITDCLKSCRNLSSSHQYQHAIDQTLVEIRNGHSLAGALASSRYFDKLLVQLIQTGEESASLDTMLDQCSHYYHEQLNNNFDRLKLMLEPVLIVSLGTMIGVILIAMYLPVFNLGSSF